MNRTVDVIIPAYRPGAEFADLIRKLNHQSVPVRAICVIHTRGGEFPEEVLRSPGVCVTHIAKEQFDHGGTRDAAIRKSDADIVLCMTQDAMPVDHYLVERLIKAFEREDVGAAYARQVPAKDCTEIERYTRAFNYPPDDCVKGMEDIDELGIKTFFCSNVCAAYRRDVYEKIGGFEKKTIFNEDMIYAGKMVKAGYKIAYCAAAEVVHSHNYSGAQQFHRNFDLAVSQVQHPEVFLGVRSESEGVRLVLRTAGYLLGRRKPYLLPGLIYISGCKYLGYQMGRRYRRLPLWLVKKCSWNTTYWGK